MRSRRRISAALVAVAVAATVAGATWMSVSAADRPADKVDLRPAKSSVTMAVDLATSRANPPSTEQIEAGKKGWQGVYAVLMSPRCMNCHPAGDRPLQTDFSRPHALNISRASVANGLECSSCHQEQNSEAIGIPGGPPGAPNWHLPHEEMPLVFEGRSPRELCEQMKRPGDNGHKSLGELLHHVSEDPLVLWGWDPGGDRTKPPLTHPEFVAAFTDWVESGGACP